MKKQLSFLIFLRTYSMKRKRERVPLVNFYGKTEMTGSLLVAKRDDFNKIEINSFPFCWIQKGKIGLFFSFLFVILLIRERERERERERDKNKISMFIDLKSLFLIIYNIRKRHSRFAYITQQTTKQNKTKTVEKRLQ